MRGRANLNVGQEAILFLQSNPANDYFTQINHGLPLGKSELRFETELKRIRRMARVYADPLTALSAKETADRQFAACVLVDRYRHALEHRDPATMRRVPIAADESRLILRALAEMKWDETPFDDDGVISLQSAFTDLQLTEKDGWKPPEPKPGDNPIELFDKEVRAWLKQHADTHRITRLVSVSPGE